MSKAKGSPRKFSEKIALLNKKEAEATAEFEKIIKEVEEKTRAPPVLQNYQPHQTQQQYWPLPTRSSSFSNWQTSPTGQNFYHQAQYQHPPHPNVRQQQQQQQTFYVDQGKHQRDGYIDNTPSSQLQTQQLHHHHHQYNLQPDSQLNALVSGAPPSGIQSAPIRVPNIAIFPIDDDYNYQQQQQQVTTTTLHHNNNLTNGYRNDCSTSISSTRSLPNIANISGTSSPTHPSALSSAFSQQRLSPTNGFSVTTTAKATTNTSCEHNNNGNYSYSETDTSFLNDQHQEYCSLPIQAYQTSPHHQTNSRNNSPSNVLDPTVAAAAATTTWQSMAATSPTTSPPIVTNINNQQIHLANTTQPQQPTLQVVHNNGYALPQQSLRPQNAGIGSTIMRASSTNIINSYESTDYLDARPISTNLSKSTEVCYGYLQS